MQSYTRAKNNKIKLIIFDFGPVLPYGDQFLLEDIPSNGGRGNNVNQMPN